MSFEKLLSVNYPCEKIKNFVLRKQKPEGLPR
jgi:hypothetical protein